MSRLLLARCLHTVAARGTGIGNWNSARELSERLFGLASPSIPVASRAALFHSQSQGEAKDSLEPATQNVARFQSPLDSGTLFIVKVPSIGNFITHGKIHKWYKSTGDRVEVGDLLCVIETEQVFGRVHSQVSGVIVETVGNEGCKVRVGSDLTIIRKEDQGSEEEDPEEQDDQNDK